MQPYRICELTELVEPDLRRVMVGYTSMQKYQVSRQESETETIIRLELVDLPAPHVRHFGEDLTADDLAHYREMLPAGYCLGAFTGEELVGFAIADARTWNRTLWIWELHVASAWQGRGIGRRLVDVLAEKAGAAGLRARWWKHRTPMFPPSGFTAAPVLKSRGLTFRIIRIMM